MSAPKRMVVSKVVGELQRRATSTANVIPVSTSIVQEVNKEATSGLSPFEVGLTLAVLLGVFLVLLFIGGLCKIFNKPRKEARPYVHGQTKLFQPSAAGYGTRIAGLKASDAKNVHGSRVSLLAGASPMGRGGRSNDVGSSVGTPNSNISQQDYFGKAGHSRGQSTGISLPGATAASSRRGGGGPAHPPVQGSPMGPDGSGFKPGQIVNYPKLGAVSPGGGPSGYASRPNGMGSQGVSQRNAPPNVGMGPPPATDSRRRSRYARADGRRIDSVGPGVIRKSMFLSGDEAAPQQEGGPRTASSNMRRVDSIGRGDHRRRSNYQGDASRQSRSASIYNNGSNSPADNFGSGRNDPLGAKGNTLSPQSRARQVRGVSPNLQQQQQQQQRQPLQQHPNMPPVQRQYSNGMPSPGAMNGAPVYGKSMQQQQSMQRPMQPMQRPTQAPMQQPMAQSSGGYSLPQAGYPGGGGPRMTSNQQFAPMAGGYDRGPRQIV